MPRPFPFPFPPPPNLLSSVSWLYGSNYNCCVLMISPASLARACGVVYCAAYACRPGISCLGSPCCVLCCVCMSARHLVPGLAVLCIVLCVHVHPASRARACSVVYCAVCACPPGISCQGLQHVCRCSASTTSCATCMRLKKRFQEFQEPVRSRAMSRRTKYCWFWWNGQCERGPLCQFAHDTQWRAWMGGPPPMDNPMLSDRPSEELMEVGES